VLARWVVRVFSPNAIQLLDYCYLISMILSLAPIHVDFFSSCKLCVASHYGSLTVYTMQVFHNKLSEKKVALTWLVS